MPIQSTRWNEIASLEQLLAGEVAVVTGAGRGNGAAIAAGLAQAGAMVCVCDIDGTSASATADAIAAAGGHAFPVTWDIANPEQAEIAIEAIRSVVPRVSILVNNAGVEAGGNIGDPTYLTSWRNVMNVNLSGTVHVIQALVADLRESRGNIVNIASMMAQLAYQPGASAYAASKAAIAQLTRSLAIELAPDGVRVNAILPGFMDTAMTAATQADAQRMDYFLCRTPMKRMGQADELIGPVLFLASRMSSYVTGAALPVDGGLMAN